LEADPETVEPAKAEAWAALESIASASECNLFPTSNSKPRRMHRRGDVYRAVPILHAAGIHNISFDLIAGLPHQTPESWRNSLDELIQLAPQHVSIYLLEVDEGSHLGSEILRGGAKYSATAVPSDDAMAESYDLARTTLAASGYLHYEISNFCQARLRFRTQSQILESRPVSWFRRRSALVFGLAKMGNHHDAAAYVQVIAAGKIPTEQLK